MQTVPQILEKKSAQNSPKHPISSEKCFFSVRGWALPTPISPQRSLLDPSLCPVEFQPEWRACFTMVGSKRSPAVFITAQCCCILRCFMSVVEFIFAARIAMQSAVYAMAIYCLSVPLSVHHTCLLCQKAHHYIVPVFSIRHVICREETLVRCL